MPSPRPSPSPSSSSSAAEGSSSSYHPRGDGGEGAETPDGVSDDDDETAQEEQQDQQQEQQEEDTEEEASQDDEQEGGSSSSCNPLEVRTNPVFRGFSPLRRHLLPACVEAHRCRDGGFVVCATCKP